jgi:poly(A) polymerase/tRNA nucleotidyltransferase (CCA-adding enzyme)
MTTPFTIPDEVSRITKTLKERGFEAYLVGGCVRDLFLGKIPKDWDVTTNAKPEDIIGMFEKTFYENDYGTVGVVNEETTDETLKVVEVTPYRTEGKYTDSRRPDFVSFNASLEDDLKRRDFTINAVALDIEKNDVVDSFKGREDIKNGLIRTVGEPRERFEEDGLRILRAVRLFAELGFKIDAETATAIEKSAGLLDKIAKERIRDEFIRILNSDEPMNGLIMAQKLGILKYIAPELEQSMGIKQNKAHAFDVWTHLLKSLQHAADKKWPLYIRLAALFHDIAKPPTRRWSEEKKEWTFYGHEVVGERITLKILRDLKFPKETIDTVTKLVRWHMFFSDTEQITLSAVRRMISNVGKDLVWDLMNLRICDRIGTGRPKENPYRLRKYKSMVEEVMRDPVSVGMLALDGSKIMEITKLPPSHKIGFMLHALLEEALENPKLNEPKILTKRVLELAKLSDEELEKLGDKGKEKKEEEEQKILKKIRKKYFVE